MPMVSAVADAVDVCVFRRRRDFSLWFDVADGQCRCEEVKPPGGVFVVLADAVVFAGDTDDARVAEDAVVDTGDCSGRAGDESGKT